MASIVEAAVPLIALACLCIPAHAQRADSHKSPADTPLVKREIPKDSSVFDKFNLKETDSGGKVQQRLELDILKDKDTFLYGNKTTNYPTSRNPGQEFQPAIPQTTPRDTYSIGIGRRF